MASTHKNAPRQAFLAGLVLAVLWFGGELAAQEAGSPDAGSLDRARSASTIQAHMEYLADDLLEGRDAGSRGEALSALYIASTYRRLGLEPLGALEPETAAPGIGAFFQTVPLRTARLDIPSVTFSVTGNGVSKSFVNGQDIMIYANLLEEEVAIEAPVVFVGHGITAPDLGLDDYKGLDVTGKIVIALGGPPAFLPAAEAAHFGSAVQKQKMAAEAGAVGLIRLWTPANEEQVPFKILKARLPVPVMGWRGDTGSVMEDSVFAFPWATVRGAAADALFQGARLSAKEVIARGKTGPVPGFALKTSLSLMLETRHDDAKASRNVGGFLEGRDPAVKDELVVVTAHYDHVGLCGAIDAADRICNGALDNAIGTSAMLDVARRFVNAGAAPARPILFLAVGAEEKGLLGSDYFAAHPLVGGRAIVATINMDGGMPFYEFSDVIAFGAEQSDLGKTLARAVAPMGLTVEPDPFPQLSIFTRSDQYSFVKRGIPSLFLYHGFTDMAGENVGRAIWNDTMATRYHQPLDDLTTRPLDYGAAAKYAAVFYRLARAVAEQEEVPRWYEDSIFGQRFAPEAPKAKRP